MSIRAEKSVQYLTFKLGNENFCIEIAKVREVLDYTEIIASSNTAGLIVGAISLRGSTVPVVDLKQSLGMSPVALGTDTCIIIVEIDFNRNIFALGALVDSVQEVFEISGVKIEAPPKIGKKFNTAFLKGMFARAKSFVMILDVDRVFSRRELEAAVEATAGLKGRRR